jgi:hypothetical protein
MSVKTKAALRTAGFVGAAIAGGTVGALFLIGVGNYFGETAAMVAFAGLVLAYVTWLVYDHNVSQIEFEEKFLNK